MFLLSDVNIACQVTDPSMLARMGAMLELKADEPTREIVRDLKDMETARQALIRDRTAAKAG